MKSIKSALEPEAEATPLVESAEAESEGGAMPWAQRAQGCRFWGLWGLLKPPTSKSWGLGFQGPES